MHTPNNKDHVRMTVSVLKDFGIEITKEQKQEMSALSTERAVDCYKMNLIRKKLLGG